MKKQIKKNIAILLSLSLLISALASIGFSASAENSQITGSDLTDTVVVTAKNLTPADFTYDTVISNNKYSGSTTFPINSSNKFEVNITDTDVVLTLTLPGNTDSWNAISGKDFTTLTAEGLKIKSYSYEYVGTLKSKQAQPAVLKVTNGTSHVGSYISPMRYSTDNYAKYVINDFTETDGVPKITEGEVYSVGASSFDWNNTYNFKVDVEYTYDEEGACRGVTVTYNYRNKDNCSTENMPSPVSQTIDFTSRTIAGKNPSLTAQSIVAVEPVIALRLNMGKTTNKKLISTYSNLAVVAEQTTDYTQDVLSFVNENPIVIDIKNDATADFSDRGEEAKNAKAAFEALNETVRSIITSNGYYNETVINSAISSIGNIKASDLAFNTATAKDVTLAPTAFSHNTIISANKYTGSQDVSIDGTTNKFEVSKTESDVVLTLTAGSYNDKWNVLGGTDFTTLTPESNAKIKSFSYQYVGSLKSRYAQPAVLKVTDDGDYSGAYISPLNFNGDYAQYTIASFSEEDPVTITSKYVWMDTSLNRSILSNVYTIKVNVEYDYDDTGACKGANITYTFIDDNGSAENLPAPIVEKISFDKGFVAGKDPSLSNNGVTAVEPVIALRLRLGKTTNKQIVSTYSNFSAVADVTVDYTDEILSFVNKHQILKDIFNGVTCGADRADEAKAAKDDFSVLDSNVAELVIKNNLYNETVLNKIIFNADYAPKAYSATIQHKAYGGTQGIRFKFSLPAVPEGYRIAEFGTVNDAYTGSDYDMSALTLDKSGTVNAKKVVAEGESVDKYFYATLTGISEIKNKYIARAYIKFVNTADNSETIVYSSNDTSEASSAVSVSNGCMVRSVISIAKAIMQTDSCKNAEGYSELYADGKYTDKATAENGKAIFEFIYNNTKAE